MALSMPAHLDTGKGDTGKSVSAPGQLEEGKVCHKPCRPKRRKLACFAMAPLTSGLHGFDYESLAECLRWEADGSAAAAGADCCQAISSSSCQIHETNNLRHASATRSP